jgi:hypothetical protein
VECWWSAKRLGKTSCDINTGNPKLRYHRYRYHYHVLFDLTNFAFDSLGVNWERHSCYERTKMAVDDRSPGSGLSVCLVRLCYIAAQWCSSF